MQTKLRRRKKFYTPGMLSLAFLLLLFVCVLLEYQKLQKQRVFEVNMYPNSHEDSQDFAYGIPNRNYHTIIITGNAQEDKINLAHFQLQLRDLLLRKDTVNGLHLLFEDKARYGSYVRAFDICLIEKAPVYIPQKDHLWIPYFIPPALKRQVPFCGNTRLSGKVAVMQSTWNGQDEETKFRFWKDLTKKFALPLIVFLVLILLSTLDIIKQIRTVVNTSSIPLT